MSVLSHLLVLGTKIQGGTLIRRGGLEHIKQQHEMINTVWWVHHVRAWEMFHNTHIYLCEGKGTRAVKKKSHARPLSQGQKG